MKAMNLRKSLIILLTSILMVVTAFMIGLCGVFSVKAEDYAPKKSEFYMLDGAQVAQVGNYGMRFTTKISKDYYDKLDAIGDVEFYTTIGPLGFTPATDYYTEELVFEDGYANIYGIITYGKLTDSQLKEKAAVELTAKAYAKVTPDNGSEEFIIEAIRNDTTRSMRAVANMALHDDSITADKEVLAKYVGEITREEEVQQLSNRNTVVEFSEKVNGRIFLNGVRTNLFVNNKKTVDLKGYINWDKVDTSETITVSVFGDNGTSVYDVVSKDVNYQLEVFYEENGKVKTDYKIIAYSTGNTAYYVPARYLIELTERGLGISEQVFEDSDNRILDYITNKTSEAKSATINDNYIVIGTQTDLFKKANLEYDAEEFEDGDYVVASKGNCIFLYGGVDTSSTSASYGNYYAVEQFLHDYFDFEVTGVLPKPVADDEITQSNKVGGFRYSFDDLVYYIREDVKNVTVESNRFSRYSPDIKNRGGNYGTYTTTLSQMLMTNGNQSETIMSAYSVTFEDYLKIADANALAKRAWKCNYVDASGVAAGHVTYSAEKPTACANAKCVEREGVDFTDITKTVEAYKKCSAYYCYTCGKMTVSFGTPESCLANYNTEINKEEHSCDGTVFVASTSASWHTAGHVFPVMNNLLEHSKWFGDDVVYACSGATCDKSYNYTDYYDAEGNKKADADRKCSCGKLIAKYYGAKTTKIACDYEDCGAEVTDTKKVGKTCEVCGEGTIVYYKGSSDPNAINEFAKVRTGSDRVPNKKQPCFTAHGDETEYKLMVAEAARKVLNNVKYVDVDRAMKNVFAISDIDGTGHCGCDTCVKEYLKYGTMASTQIKFLNDLSKFIDDWMDKDTASISSWLGEADVSSWWTIYDEAQEKYVPIEDMTPYQRTITHHFFAYMSGSETSTSRDKKAPVKTENGVIVAIDDSVKMYQGKYNSTGVYLVTSADSFKNIPKLDENGNFNGEYYTREEMLAGKYQFSGTDNIFKYLVEDEGTVISAQQDMKEWSALSNGTKMYLWVNTQSSNYTTVPYYSANLFDAEFFTFMENAGVDTLFCYASAAEGNALTAFNNLKLYVTAKRMWDTEANLEELYETWFNVTFVDDEIVNKMKEAFNLEMTMAVRANYLTANSKDKYNQDLENGVQLGNSQAYTSIMGQFGEYWDVGQLIDLYNIFKKADARLNEMAIASANVTIAGETPTEAEISEAWENLDRQTKLKYTKIKAMLYSEWYAPLVTIMRYYQNDAMIIPLRNEYVKKFKEIIDLTGIKYNAEYAPPTAPTSDMVYYTTQLEVVILDLTADKGKDNAVLATYGLEYELPKDKNGNYYKDFNGNKACDDGETIYNLLTGELNLMEGQKYRVLLRVTEDLYDRDGKPVYAKGSYIVSGNSTYFGYQKNVSLGVSGRCVQEWGNYYSCAKASCIITTNTEREKNSYYDIDTKAAFEDPADRDADFAGKNDAHDITTTYFNGASRRVAVNCDELNLSVGMGVTNWAGETIYTIRINIIEKAS